MGPAVGLIGDLDSPLIHISNIMGRRWCNGERGLELVPDSTYPTCLKCIGIVDHPGVFDLMKYWQKD